MLAPEVDEKQGAYVVRFMQDEEAIERYPDDDQRMQQARICWRNYKVHGSVLGRASFNRGLQGAEIMSVGEWNGWSFDIDDLNTIVASFQALGLKGRIPLKFGHTGEAPVDEAGMPALGWVQRVYRTGGKLLADFANIPNVVVESIQKGLYKFVSVELLRNVKADNRVIPWVLDAVALLGADPPAVGNLKDLQSLMMTRKVPFEHEAVVTFRREDTETTIEESSSMAMTDAEKKELEELRRKTVTFERANEDLQKKLDEQAKLNDKNRIDNHRAVIMALFERAIEAKKILPRSRERFERLYRVNDDKFVDAIKREDAEAFIKEAEEGDKIELARLKKDEIQSKNKDKGTEVERGTNAEVFTNRAAKLAVEMGYKADDATGLDKASKVLLRRDPKLAKAYMDDPRGEFKDETEDKKEDAA